MPDFDNSQDDEHQIPKSLRNRVSSRWCTLWSFVGTIEKVNDPNFQGLSADRPVHPVLITKAGQVTGDILLDGPEGFDATAAEVMKLTRNRTVKNLEAENGGNVDVIGSSAYLIIKDAVLIPWGAPQSSFRYQTLYLFADDIIGFSLGSND